MELLELRVSALKEVLKNLSLKELLKTAVTCHAMDSFISENCLGVQNPIQVIAQQVMEEVVPA